MPLELIDLILTVAQLLQHARQLPLVRGALLGPAHGLVQPRRPAHEDLDVGLLGLRQHRLEQLLGDVALALLPALGRVVEDVEGAKAVRVRVLEVLELVLEQDVGFRQVAEDERHFGLVGRVLEDGPRELVHALSGRSCQRCRSRLGFFWNGVGRVEVDLRRDACSTGDQSDVIVLVRLPWILGDRALEIEPLIRLHGMQVLTHRPVGIPLDHQIDIPLRILVARRRVRPDNGLLHLGALVLGEEGRRDREARHVIAVGEGEAEFLRVVVDLLDGLEFQADEALLAAAEGGLGRRGGGGGGRGHGLAFVGGGGRVGFGFRFGDPVVVVSSS